MSLLKRKEQELEELYFDDYDKEEETLKEEVEQLETEEELERYTLKQQKKNELKDDIFNQVTEDVKKELLEDDELPQIIETIDEEEYDSKYNSQSKKRKRYIRWKRIINTVFIIILVILAMITIDVIAVSKYNNGPFFTIKTKTYKDGGTKEYYGFGYKVISYNQEVGRRDKELGTWKLKYNTEPTDLSDIDLAIEFNEDPQATNVKYYKKFVRLSSTVKSVNVDKKQMTLEYRDEDNKYTFDIVCSMAKGQENVGIFEKGDTVYILGTVKKFKLNPNKVYLNDCFAESYEIISEDEVTE